MRPRGRRNPAEEGSRILIEISRTVVSMSTAGLLVLGAGVIASRSISASGLAPGTLTGRAIALGRVFVAAPLAAFGALHLAAARGLMEMVPGYMPWPLLWVYLVGFGLIATALSLIFDRLVVWSSLLAGGMFLAFVAMMDLPGVITAQHDRFGFALLARETTFGCALLCLGGSLAPRGSRWASLVTPCRIVFAVVAIFYGVEHFLHPEFLPGVPLEKLTPAGVPVPRFWGYLVGWALLVSGAMILLNRWASYAAARLGIVLAATVAIIYVPMLGPAHGTGQVVEVIDYIFDTLLYAGTALIVAEALRRSEIRNVGRASVSKTG
jgi:uncharacterized membrane protein